MLLIANFSILIINRYQSLPLFLCCLLQLPSRTLLLQEKLALAFINYPQHSRADTFAHIRYDLTCISTFSKSRLGGDRIGALS